MAAGFFNWLNDEYSPSNILISSLNDIRFLFFLFWGFSALFATVWIIHKLALARAKHLRLTDIEIY
jgi:hypothetical protein